MNNVYIGGTLLSDFPKILVLARTAQQMFKEGFSTKSINKILLSSHNSDSAINGVMTFQVNSCVFKAAILSSNSILVTSNFCQVLCYLHC